MSDFEAYVSLNEELSQTESSMEMKKTSQRLAVMEKEHELRELQERSQRQRELLYNTLPDHIAERMLNGEDVSGDEYPSAAVMFCDVVGFTAGSRDLPARKVTETLEKVFGSFDSICTEHRITKIKTIGDSYLAVAFEDDESSAAERLARAAVQMNQLDLRWPDSAAVKFRFGMHCGPVVAGVVGTQRYQYDVWGDTVNTASRLESQCEAGQISISESLAQQLNSGLFNVLEGPRLELKGLGEQRTYLLEAVNSSQA